MINFISQNFSEAARLLRASCFPAALLLAACVVSALGEDANEGIPFGVAPSAQSFENYPSWMPKMKDLGVRWVRSSIARIHPGPKEWNWAKVDAYTEALAANKMSAICTLFHNTPWVKKESPTYQADLLAAWTEYVSGLVGHVQGKIKYWEVWNEPQNFFFKDDPAGYGRYVAAAYDAAKAVDPNCRIGMGVASVDANYMARAIAGGAAGHFDFIAVHPYESLGKVDKIGNGSFLGIVKTIRNMLAEADPPRRDVPIWFSEIGAQVPKYMTEVRQGQNLFKVYVLALAQDAAGVNWYEAQEGDPGFGMIDKQGKPRPAYFAMKTLTRFLDPKAAYQGWVLLGKDSLGFCFNGPSGPVLAVWTAPNAAETVSFSADTTIIDPLAGDGSTKLPAGQPLALTNAPVLVANIPAELASEARANRDRPFPWDGDYSQAGSVSVEFGSPVVEKGLHRLDSSEVAVTAFGGPAGDMSRLPGAAFAVDPNFIAYTPKRVTISVTARRQENNDEAGFLLKYESTDGYKQTAPFLIPGNDQWYTQTWTLDDAAFSGKWVYNFTVLPVDKEHGKYYIQKVMVTK